jgi:hypothetical protein
MSIHRLVIESILLKTTMHNRSVYVIGFPHRENLLAKEGR